jgi:Spy/CpxP family protein refolding chaperone
MTHTPGKHTGWLWMAMVALIASLFVPMQASANRMRRMARQLNLTAAQQQSIKTIVYQSRRSMITLKAQLQLARLDLSQLLDQHKPDQKAVVTALDKVGALELQMKKKRILMMLKIKALLTPQQATKWRQIQTRRRARRRRMRRRWRKMRRRRWQRRRRMRQGGGQP